MAPKYVLITGCSAGGIGSALAVAFQKRGLSVIATGRDLLKLSHLEDLPNVTILPLNPTSGASVEAAVDKVKAITGSKLDYLVNNAGQTLIMPTLDFDIETAKRMYDINVWGAVRVTQAFADLVIAAKGTIVNICSISTSVNTPWMGEFQCHKNTRLTAKFAELDPTGIYAGSKAAETAITDAFRLEMAPFGVKVITVHTGGVSTNQFSASKDFKLPETSCYKSIEKEISARARGEDGLPRFKAAEYAERVVGDVLGGSTWQIWRGSYASIVRYTSAWFPASVSVSRDFRDWLHCVCVCLEAYILIRMPCRFEGLDWTL